MGPAPAGLRGGEKQAMEEKSKLHVVISGRVQGVAYRYATLQAAERFDVKGWVRNLPDGTVEALFEGSTEDVEKMLDWCRGGPPSARVENIEVSRRPYTGEFSRFDITF
jgi:acylphosphatase